MSDALVHRGPDDQGAVLLGEAGLAMRRLAIIDLARGHQPIANEDASAGPEAPAPDLDLRSLDEYLTLRFIPSPRTLFQGIHKLPPAHLLVLDASAIEPPRAGPLALAPAPAIEVRRYWQLRYTPKRSDREADL